MLILLALACSGAPTPPADPAPAALPELRADDAGTPLDAHMKEHFRDATLGIEAWVGGNFEAAYTHFGYLAKHPAAKGLPAGAEAHVKTMQDAAGRAAAPAPPEATASALADLGAACGTCHAEQGVTPTIQLSDAPDPSADVQPHMVGHLWAVRGLWIGLVTNDEAPWTRGATHLSGDALHGEAFGIGEMPENLVKTAERVHEGGRAAAAASTPDARRAAFVAIVSACGDCHLEMRGE